MSALDLYRSHRLVVARCFICGKFHAHETIREDDSKCVVCTREAYRTLDAERAKAERSASALRGALTKARKAARRG